MALINQISNACKVTHVALNKRYSINDMSDDGKWEVHRYTTKRFSFVGLSESAAMSGAAQVITGLTRFFYLWKTNDMGEREKVKALLMPDEVAAIHDGGTMWRVDVNVSEDDTLFVDERDLDEDLSLLNWPQGGDYWES